MFATDSESLVSYVIFMGPEDIILDVNTGELSFSFLDYEFQNFYSIVVQVCVHMKD